MTRLPSLRPDASALVVSVPPARGAIEAVVIAPAECRNSPPGPMGLGGAFTFEVASHRPTPVSGTATNFLGGYTSGLTLSVVSPAQHGDVTLAADGGFTYTPSGGDEPYLGWDFFEVKAANAAGLERRAWVQLFVGISGPPQTPNESPPPGVPAGDPALATGSGYAGARASVDEAQARLTQVYRALAGLAEAKHAIAAAATPDAIDAAMSDERGRVREVEQAHDGYLNQLDAAGRAVADYLASVWFTSSAVRELDKDYKLLPVSVGSIKASKEHLERLLGGAGAYTNASALLVSISTATIQYAEYTRNLFAAVSAGGLTLGGGGAVLFTLERVLVREGFRQFAKASTFVALQVGVAYGLNTYVSAPLVEKMQLTPEKLALVNLGLAAFQSSKAAQILASKVVSAAGRIFRAPLRLNGTPKLLEFPGVRTTSRTFTIPSQARYNELNAAADAAKTRWVQDLADNPAALDQLRKAGVKLSPLDIQNMRIHGRRPTGFDVHHKDPLKFGGSNDSSNFILMQNKDSGKANFHSALTNYQNSLTRDFPANETTFETQWPVFDGIVYPPKLER